MYGKFADKIYVYKETHAFICFFYKYDSVRTTAYVSINITTITVRQYNVFLQCLINCYRSNKFNSKTRKEMKE